MKKREIGQEELVVSHVSLSTSLTITADQGVLSLMALNSLDFMCGNIRNAREL